MGTAQLILSSRLHRANEVFVESYMASVSCNPKKKSMSHQARPCCALQQNAQGLEYDICRVCSIRNRKCTSTTPCDKPVEFGLGYVPILTSSHMNSLKNDVPPTPSPASGAGILWEARS